jgi:hypothetical protein
MKPHHHSSPSDAVIKLLNVKRLLSHNRDAEILSLPPMKDRAIYMSVHIFAAAHVSVKKSCDFNMHLFLTWKLTRHPSFNFNRLSFTGCKVPSWVQRSLGGPADAFARSVAA